ncbi:DEAD/DEAH box helicase [Candidatus Woesearchaeota archaeon]|nr:DEAD/DEAH box helicase [Candidatus Woesearchaeota archaeon]
MNLKNFNPRKYQEEIVETAKKRNTLVVLPTGLGKTKVAILLTKERLNQFQATKAAILTPTKPLASQIQKEFQECLDLAPEKIVLLTGAVSPEKRRGIYEESQIIVATPQTVQEDIEKNRINLEQFSLLVIDEAHRSREKFANTVVAKAYEERGKNKRILALTDSP